MRSRRKIDHLNIAAALGAHPYGTGLEDVNLIHHSVPELDIDDINIKADLFGRTLGSPIIINAMTGGIDEAYEINRSLAEVAGEKNIAMAVGSQSIALENKEQDRSFRIVRKVNPNGVVLANMAASVQPSEALRAIEMIKADGLQLHLNVPQELAMLEGDRKFYGISDNVAEIVRQSPIPVIAKEVGFGMSSQCVRQLYEAGVRYFDIGGRGGTNFIAIEETRQALLGEDFIPWGIPTAVSIVEACSLNLPITVIASGGVNNGLEAAKCIALGADLVGIAGTLLKRLVDGGKAAVVREVERVQYQLQCAMLMTGARDLKSLQNKPLVVLGNTGQWLSARGIDITAMARR